MEQTLLTQFAASRIRQLRLGVWIELATIGWMTVEATVALFVGFTAHSVSLQGYGMDSLIELLAGSILLWRLLIESQARKCRFPRLSRARFSAMRVCCST